MISFLTLLLNVISLDSQKMLVHGFDVGNLSVLECWNEHGEIKKKKNLSSEGRSGYLQNRLSLFEQ